MNYAISLDCVSKENPGWIFTPWKLKGAIIYDKISKVPDNSILVVSHFAPWWEPLKTYINEKRPWIEIDYGYWGKNSPKRESRRVTFNGHHNLNLKNIPYNRSQLFLEPEIAPWRKSKGSYILGILPIEEHLLKRTGETIQDFKNRLTPIISQYYDGPIVWRKKVGQLKFQSLQEQIKNADAVVGERTMACVEACLLGVPGYTIDHSMASLLMGDISNLQNISYPDRTKWFEHICWSQFNINEFSTVVPAELTEQYQIL